MNAWSNCKFSNLIFNDVVTYNEIGTSICGTQTEIIAIRYWDVHKNIQYTSQKMNSWIINKLDSSLRFCRPKPPTSKVARVSTWLLATPKLYSDLNLNTSISIFGQIWVSKCSNFTKAKIATLQILTLRSSKLVKWRKRLYLDYCTTFNIRNTDLPINDDGIRRGFISVTTRFLFAASTEIKKRKS